MQRKEIFASIPSIIGKFFSHIYCLDKVENKCYSVEYLGNELRIKEDTNYTDFTNKFASYPDFITKLETRDAAKIVIDDMVISWETLENYKIVLMSTIKEKEEKKDHKLKILIADDSPVITKFFTKTFQDEYDILVASNGDEAIKLINENINNDLVGAFLDLQMPVKNGFEVLDYLKENDLFKKVPISVISGEDSEDGIKRATNYDIVDMLQKPFSADAARSIVNKTLQHKKED